MNDSPDRLFYFDASTGQLMDSDQFVPEKSGNLFLVLNRGMLFFNEISIKAGHKLKTSDILAIQNNMVPLSPPYSNMIFKVGDRKIQRFICWVGQVQVDENIVFYDEIPESLLFKGNPDNLKHYRLFVFKRITGIEIIYFDQRFFYSYYERDKSKVAERLVTLGRKYSLQGRLSVLTDADFPNEYNMDVVQLEDSQSHFLLLDHYNINKIFSNFSQHKRMKKVKRIVKSIDRYLNIFLVLLLVLLTAAGYFHLVLQRDRSSLKSDMKRINRIIEESDRIEWGLAEIKKKISSYPDHFRYLRTIQEALDDDSFLSHLSLLKDKIILEGNSKNSLAILSILEKSLLFSKVSFNSAVKKDIYSQTESFSISIELKKDG
jgi:hypothetical protein